MVVKFRFSKKDYNNLNEIKADVLGLYNVMNPRHILYSNQLIRDKLSL